jgi:hypothetical protein
MCLGLISTMITIVSKFYLDFIIVLFHVIIKFFDLNSIYLFILIIFMIINSIDR